jgi:hypothetical protein
MSDKQDMINNEMVRTARRLSEPYPPPNADERRIMARIDALERKVDQVLALLKADPSPPGNTTS